MFSLYHEDYASNVRLQSFHHYFLPKLSLHNLLYSRLNLWVADHIYSIAFSILLFEGLRGVQTHELTVDEDADARAERLCLIH